MKILMVSDAVPAPKLGGLARQLVTQANALIDAGHHVDMIGLQHVSYAACRAEMGFKGRYIAALPNVNGGWKERATGAYNPLKRPFHAWRVARIINHMAEDYAVVHYHGQLPLVGAFVKRHVNFVQTLHDQTFDCLQRTRFANGQVCSAMSTRTCAGCAKAAPNKLQTLVSALSVWVYRRLVAAAFKRHKSIFVSEFLRKNASRVYPDIGAFRSHVVHNALGLAPPGLNLAEMLQQDAPLHVAISARLDEPKGVPQFLSALQACTITKQCAIEVTVIGDGPLATALQRAPANAGVRFMGHCDYQTALTHMLAADAVVMPSVWEEAFGLTTLEALSLGKPCYALRRGASPELAQYERWPGQLRLFDDMAELVAQLSEDARRQAHRVPRELGAARHKTADQIAQELLRIYV